MSEDIRCFFLIKDPGLVGRVIWVFCAQVGTDDAARAGLAGVPELAGKFDWSIGGHSRSVRQGADVKNTHVE